jgi:hypothetical protein
MSRHVALPEPTILTDCGSTIRICDIDVSVGGALVQCNNREQRDDDGGRADLTVAEADPQARATDDRKITKGSETKRKRSGGSCLSAS